MAKELPDLKVGDIIVVEHRALNSAYTIAKVTAPPTAQMMTITTYRSYKGEGHWSDEPSKRKRDAFRYRVPEGTDIQSLANRLEDLRRELGIAEQALALKFVSDVKAAVLEGVR